MLQWKRGWVLYGLVLTDCECVLHYMLHFFYQKKPGDSGVYWPLFGRSACYFVLQVRHMLKEANNLIRAAEETNKDLSSKATVVSPFPGMSIGS